MERGEGVRERERERERERKAEYESQRVWMGGWGVGVRV